MNYERIRYQRKKITEAEKLLEEAKTPTIRQRCKFKLRKEIKQLNPEKNEN